MKFSTFYFSGTGNTEWAVKEFNQLVIEKGHEYESISIESIKNKETSFLEDIIDRSDFVGFANPIYGGNLPPIMKNFIIKLTKVCENKKEISRPVYIINTIAYVNGFGPFCAKKLFINTNFRIISYVNIQLCNNISTPKLKIKALSTDKMNKRKEKAKGQLLKMIDMMLEGKKYINGVGFYLIPNIFIRRVSKDAIENNYKALSIDIATCSRCMLCVNRCPTKSIEYKENKFIFLPSCTACMRCYNNCSSSSILFNGKYADPKIYERYHGPSSSKD
ncbi:EFR1 family ferrodoxin [Clostridium sp. C8-1-8]|uniref:EFR1 family ferrodoxin n=1 Tax=Clostridium sp. C8-1-8 TaxID=2698831 RepID=UPI0013695410|nr:EFR1 family ferrodoxin [Clostridium sp. C8-1-8]